MEQTTARVRVLGESDAMERVREEIRILGAVDATALIEGETGTRKTLVAHAIHAASRRRDGPLVPWLDAWPSGSPSASGAVAHVPGSVGGAKGEGLGPFEAALGGTLLLEEIGEMPLSMQATLLRVLEAPDLAGVHESVPRRLDVRVLATTHRPLDREVASGRFRRDLFYRIRVARIVLPPLRKRLLEALQRVGGNRSIAARLLGVSRSTLYRHLAERRPPDDDRGR